MVVKDDKGRSALGIKIWHCSQDETSIVADIVAVHGFAANPYWTWVGKQKQTKTRSDSKVEFDSNTASTEVIWLETLLPVLVPNCRVLSFGYESQYVHRALRRSMGNCAQELLSALELERAGTAWINRPIIFLGHSFGGIVIKEAMVKASLATEQFGHIKRSTHGIVFLGTPHYGSGIASYGETLVTAAKAIGWRVDTRLLSSLRRSSAELLQLADYFGDIHDDFELHCFYELLPWKFGRLIVDEPSAVIAGKPKNCLTTDHTGLNKYTHIDDPNFRKIVGILSKMASSAAQQSRQDCGRSGNNEQQSLPEASHSRDAPFIYTVNLVKKAEKLFEETLKAALANSTSQDEWMTLILQRQQFKSWAYTVGLGCIFGMSRALHPCLCLPTINEISSVLEDIISTLGRITFDCSATDSSQVLTIARDLDNCFTHLADCLPVNQRGTLRHVMTTNLVLSTELVEQSDHADQITSLSDVETISAMRRINLLIERSEARRTVDNLYVKLGSELVLDKHKSPFRTPGKLFHGGAQARAFGQVLVEWKHYHGLWDTTIGNELFQRVELLTDFLRTASRSRTNEVLRFLECYGYCHDKDRKRLGFVFGIPSSVTRRSSYIRLNTLLRAFADQKVLPPSVNERIHLARTLCAAMFHFHNTGWFHKGFCTNNILVFSEVDAGELSVRDYSILAPYVVGFVHSRPSKPTDFSEPMSLSDEWRRYHHPAVKNIPEQKYLHEYDYYSLGAVLLEIGQWKPLSSIMSGKISLEKSSPFDFADELRNAKCGELNSFVGHGYEQAVGGLLSAFEEERIDLDQNEYVPQGRLLQFQADVLDCLNEI